eukprot:NODE_10553_length_484_cov_27.294118_g10530_i0.p1 GENE.NODE_10553_length_484_cov_27.294118_g10530_i0~~NODE_10553_length_484_cov_27.294118_g10530_i0.p1  ORF type:complete len:144 (-),score=28.46 NODE_10553_length_484_cov_27.294118_g10530_i0:51-458(-)
MAAEAASTAGVKQGLVQALHLKDDTLMEQYLIQEVVALDTTVQSLQPAHVQQLLAYCTRRLQQNPNSAPKIIPWIRSILLHHSVHLLSQPETAQLLEPLQGILADHIGTFDKLTQLHGRLDLLVAASNMKAANPK